MKLVVAFVVLAAGCMKHSDKYCAMHPEDTVNCSSGGDGGVACLGNDDCIAIDPAKPVCADDDVCVQCTVEDSGACTGGQVCRGNRTCGDCTEHVECSSLVCQVNGRCADETMVAYVAPTGGGSACTALSPCSNMPAAETTGRPIIKITGTITDTTSVLFDARSTTIYADPGAALTRSTAGNIVEVTNTGTELAIYGLRIFGGTGLNGTGNGVIVLMQTDPKLTLDRVLIDSNDGSGVRATDGGDITITRSVIAANTGNPGIVMQNNKFSITNTIIVQNGKATLPNAGGAILQPSAASTFEFNTVADNISMGGAGNYRGITCGSGFVISNSIIVGNDTANCDVTYSLFTPGDLVTDTGNMTGDAMFKTTAMPSAPTFYRITPTSAAKDRADMAATLTIDIDGNMRPIDGRSDMGADEVAP